MAVFGRKNEASEGDYVTHSEARNALSAYITKEDARVVVNDIAALRDKVAILEGLANDMRRSLPVRQAGTYDGVTGGSRASTPARGGAVMVEGVDYGAIAFGLSEIKRQVAIAMNTAGVSVQTLTSHFEGTVQYFADVFAKSDPSFDEDDFKVKAGV